jgi:NAD-dependent dihydropyrimidine dehydrogenase PreA subunit
MVWGPGKQGAATADENVKAAYSQSGQSMQPLGIHGTFVAVDWDDCVADGGCLPVCPVAVFEWLQNPGKSGKDERAGYADKSDPIRESDCIFCMACVTVCPTTAIKVDQSLVALGKQQPGSAQEPSPAQKPAPAPTPTQQPAPAQQPTAQGPAPAQQPKAARQPVQPERPQAPGRPSTQAPPPAQQSFLGQQQSPQLAQQISQVAQQLSQLALQLAQIAQQAQQQVPAQHPAAQVSSPAQAPPPVQGPADKSATSTTGTEIEKQVPDRNLPTN